MDNGGQLVHHEGAELSFNGPLQVVPNELNGIEGRRDLERLKRVIAENQRQPLLPREDQDDESRQLDFRQGDLKRNRQARSCGKRLRRREGRLRVEVGI